MNTFRADLHCHSNYSDGTLSPEELIELAKQSGLQALSITDHDSISAYERAMPYAQKCGVELVPGVEFSAELEQTGVHILAYAFDVQDASIQKFCERHDRRRQERYRNILAKLAEQKIYLTEADIIEAYQTVTNSIPRSIGRPHIALALKAKGYVKEMQEAFRRYIGENQPCFVKGDCFSVQETIDQIHQSGGLAMIAHPHLITSPAILQHLLKMPFDGIECFYGNFPYERNKRWLEIAKQKNWLIAGGSDFHGSLRPHIALGSSWVNEECFQALRASYKCNQLSS